MKVGKKLGQQRKKTRRMSGWWRSREKKQGGGVNKDVDKSCREKTRRTRETNMRTRIVVDKYAKPVAM